MIQKTSEDSARNAGETRLELAFKPGRVIDREEARTQHNIVIHGHSLSLELHAAQANFQRLSAAFPWQWQFAKRGQGTRNDSRRMRHGF